MRLPRLLGRSVPAADLRAVKLLLRTAEFARSAAELALSEERLKVAALLPAKIRGDVKAGLLVQAHEDLSALVERYAVVQDVSAARAHRQLRLENGIREYLSHPAGKKGYAAAREALFALLVKP